MFRSGAFVADHVRPTRDDQVQPNGVDLTIDAVYEQVAPGRITRDGKAIGDRTAVATAEDSGAVDPGESTDTADDDRDRFVLAPGTYIAEYGEVIAVPDGHVGFVLPRSSLMRNSGMIHTAVWDAGYEGRGEGLLEVHFEIELDRGARIAQLVFAAADHETTYDGDYQRERL